MSNNIKTFLLCFLLFSCDTKYKFISIKKTNIPIPQKPAQITIKPQICKCNESKVCLSGGDLRKIIIYNEEMSLYSKNLLDQVEYYKK